MTSDQREKKPLSCGTAQNISHLRLRYPLGTWNTRVSRRFGRIRELPLLLASRLQGQDPPSLGWTYYDSLGPASDGPAHLTPYLLVFKDNTAAQYLHFLQSSFEKNGILVIIWSLSFMGYEGILLAVSTAVKMR